MSDIQKHALLTAGVGGALMLTAAVASAKLDLCQQQINLQATRYQSAITKALQGCENAVRKEQVKDAAHAGTGSIANAAKLCELQLAKVYGVAGAPRPFTGKTAVQKLRDTWTRMRAGRCTQGANNGTVCTTDAQCDPTPPTCTNGMCSNSATNGAPCTSHGVCPPVPAVCSAPCRDEDIANVTGMGHLLSGAGGTAPPLAGDAGQFAGDWILVTQEKLAIKRALSLTPDALTLLRAAVSAAPDHIRSSTGVASHKGTNCSGTTFDTLTEEYRPNLCRFGIECRDHACTLAGTSQLTFLSAPLEGLFGGAENFNLSGNVVIEMCKLGGTSGVCFDAPQPPCTTDTDCPISPTNQCSFSSGQGLGAQFGAEPGFLYLISEPSKTIKVTIPPYLAGWFAAVCVNNIRSEGWCDCVGGSGVLKNTNFCVDQWTGDNAGPNDDCGSSLTLKTPSVLYQNSFNGALKIMPSGPADAGDCVDLLTTQFKIILATADYGADTTPCTMDDFAAPSAPAQLPITTGTAVASIKDAVASPGSCNLTGNFCIENANCVNLCSAATAGTCSATGAACTGGPSTVGTCNPTADQPCDDQSQSLTDIQVGPFTGSGTSCTNYETSNLSGLSLVGAFPALATDFANIFGDHVTGFELTCQ